MNNVEYFPTKDIDEKVNLVFDFSKMAEWVVNPTVTIEVTSYTQDPDPEQLIYTAPTYVNAKVVVPVRGGLADVDYLIRCRVTTNSGDDLLLAGILSVRRFG
jgi:hypothetical protein